MHLTPNGKVLVLRSADANRQSRDGFQYPETGSVQAPDFDPDPDRSCGGGLHGLPWGQGDLYLTYPDNPSNIWQVIEVDPADFAITGPDKARFRGGNVILSTPDPHKAAALLASHNPPDPVPFHTATAGNYGTAAAGHGGTAAAGYYGTATTGNDGTAAAGNGGTAAAGHGGTATAGNDGTATAGHGGTLRVTWYDSEVNRYRTGVAYPGENGILPDTPYHLDPTTHKFTEGPHHR